MPAQKLLLLSNSTMAGGKWLETWKLAIVNFLKESKVSKITFVPFAGVSLSWDEYTEKVQGQLTDFKVEGLHQTSNMKDAVDGAEAIMIGGGNSFHLLHTLQTNDLIEAIRIRVSNGTPYIGWSAGSNVATPDIGTTNDMPVIWPVTDKALSLVPFNINPHYNEWKAPNQNGESRGDRLNEAVLVKRRAIVALAEGTGIMTEEDPPKYLVLKCAPNFIPPGIQLQVKVWLPTDDDAKFKVVEVPLGDGGDPVLLNPYLK
jgi:dipeptidase E